MNPYHEKESKCFLDWIAEDPEDRSRRPIYADWLEERGYDDEALRQRRWWQSADWLVAFARRWNFFNCTGSDNWEWDHVAQKLVEYPVVVMPDNEIIERLIEEVAVLTGDKKIDDWDRDVYLTAYGIDLHGADELEGDDVRFWEHMETITGEKYGDERRQNLGWSCSC